jgi:CHAT domain-containing protein
VDLIAGRRAAIRAKGEGVLAYDGVHWLGQGADLSLVVSAASFVQARGFPASAGKHAFLGMGDSVQPLASDPRAYASVVNWGGAGQADVDVCQQTRDALLALKPLKEAAKELNTVGASLDPADAQVITGAAFNDADITQRKDLDQYRVVYFATHGLLPKPGGCLPEPALLTSVGDQAASDGLLTASKILQMKLDADLVVLSACDTGGGGGANGADMTGLAGGGEALGGLTRAFIYAGARSLIVSHWSIDSEATVRLMTAMFASHAPTQSGALREAALGLMASPDQYSHPYYWAAFTVVGDGARAMPAR